MGLSSDSPRSTPRCVEDLHVPLCRSVLGVGASTGAGAGSYQAGTVHGTVWCGTVVSVYNGVDLRPRLFNSEAVGPPPLRVEPACWAPTPLEDRLEETRLGLGRSSSRWPHFYICHDTQLNASPIAGT
jgi:hypothetical protein